MSHEKNKQTSSKSSVLTSHHVNKSQKIAAEDDTEELPKNLEDSLKTKNEDSPEEEADCPVDEKLKNQLIILEKEVAVYKEASLRAQAQLENMQKRAERDINNAHKFGIGRLLTDLLPVIDSLIRALENADSQDPKVQVMSEGVRLTLHLLNKTLERHGVETLRPEQGESFNPEWHEAMTTKSDSNAKPNTVLQVLQTGYRLNGRVLRAAMVVVSK